MLISLAEVIDFQFHSLTLANQSDYFYLDFWKFILMIYPLGPPFQIFLVQALFSQLVCIFPLIAPMMITRL